MADMNFISDQLADLQRSMGNVEAKIGSALEDGKDQERRLRKVENKLHWYSGAAAIIGAGFSVVTGFFSKA